MLKLKHHTCEQYYDCGYTTDSHNEHTLAAHLRTVHKRSSRGCADIWEFIAEGFIVECDPEEMQEIINQRAENARNGLPPGCYCVQLEGGLTCLECKRAQGLSIF